MWSMEKLQLSSQPSRAQNPRISTKSGTREAPCVHTFPEGSHIARYAQLLLSESAAVITFHAPKSVVT